MAATEPLTSHSTTSFGFWMRSCFQIVRKGMPSQPMFRRRVRRTSSTPRRSRLRLRPYCVASRRAMARTSSRMRSWSRRSMADSRVCVSIRSRKASVSPRA